MNTNIFSFMTELFKIHGVQIMMVSSLDEIDSGLDYGLREYLFKDFIYKSYIKEIFKDFVPGTLYYVEDDFGFFYSVFLFSDDSEEYTGKYIFAGPVILYQMNSAKLKSIVEEKCIQPDLIGRLAEFYHRMPVYSPLDKWISTLSLFLSKLTGKEVGNIYLAYQDKSLFDIFPEKISPDDNLCLLLQPEIPKKHF